LAAFIWEPFNKPEYCVSFVKDDDSFATDANHGITTTVPTLLVLASLLDGVQPLYYLHLRDWNTAMLAGAYRGKVTYVERRYGYSRPGVSPLKIILIYSNKS
jgi:hypothetical protein